MKYLERIRRTLRPDELRIFRLLKTPEKIQDYLDALPINFELQGQTYMSPRRVVAQKQCHCMEGALFAAAVLAFHGQKPLLLDMQSSAEDDDHVVALFRRGRYWGAISKTNHPVLRYRDAIYPSVEALALSYFHEYFMENGKKTLRTYSAPFDLTRYAPEKWVTAGEELHTIVDALDASRHFPLVPKKMLRSLRRATPFEIKATALTEWNERGAKGSAGS
jgi:hypothetical protein